MGKYIWKKILAARWCKWVGIDGNTYEKNRYVGVIFYSIDEVLTLTKPYFLSNFMGGASMQESIRSVNSCLMSGDLPVTEQEINEQLKIFSDQVRKDHEYGRIDCEAESDRC